MFEHVYIFLIFFFFLCMFDNFSLIIYVCLIMFDQPG